MIRNFYNSDYGHDATCPRGNMWSRKQGKCDELHRDMAQHIPPGSYWCEGVQ